MPKAQGTDAERVTVKRNPIVGLLADRSLAVKNVVAVIAMAAVAVAVGTLGLYRISAMSNNLALMKSSHVDSLQQVAELRSGISDGFRGMLVYTYGVDAAGKKVGRDAVTVSDVKTDDALSAYAAIAADSPSRQRSLASFASAIKHYRALRNTVIFQEP